MIGNLYLNGIKNKKKATIKQLVILFFVLYAFFLLPVGIEKNLLFKVQQVPISILELFCLLVLIFKIPNIRYGLFVWSAIGIIYNLILVLFLNNGIYSNLIVSSVEFYLPFILVSAIDFNYSKDWLRVFLVFLLMILNIEVILFSTGVLSYSKNIAVSEFSGYYRIYTTVGSATATGGVLFILYFWFIDLWRKSVRFSLFVTFVTAVSIFLTFSRGSILMFLILSFVYFIYIIKVGYGKNKVRKFTAVLILLGFCGWWLSNSGLYGSLLNRIETTASSDSGRIERLFEAKDIYERKPIFGFGPGRYLAKKRLSESRFQVVGKTSPHNMYLLNLVEGGVVGLVFFMIGIVFICKKIIHSNKTYMFKVGIVLLVIVGFNSEILYGEFPYALLVASAIKYGFDRG